MASLAGLKRRLDPIRVEALYLARGKLLGRRVERPPIAIVGCGHSGTTLLLSILDAHSAIYGVPYESGLGRSEGAEFRQKTQLFDKLTIAAGKIRWVEKTPTNTLYLDNLFRNLPELKVIAMIRDGRDVACSMAARFEAKLGSREAAFAHSVDRWANENLAWRKHEADPRVLPIKYEDLVRRFDATVTTIVEFLGERFEPQLREFHQNPKNFLESTRTDKTPPSTQHNLHDVRNWQVHRPLFDGSDRWRAEMTELEKPLFKAKAGQLLMDFGYVEDLEW
jgi:hypothetical protein